MLRVAPQLSIEGTRFRLTISRTVFLLSPKFAGAQAIAAPFSSPGEDFWGEAIGFRPLSGSAAETLAARLRRGDVGADALHGLLYHEADLSIGNHHTDGG